MPSAIGIEVITFSKVWNVGVMCLNFLCLRSFLQSGCRQRYQSKWPAIVERERNQGGNKATKKDFVGIGVCFLLLLLSFVCVGRLVNHKADAGSYRRERQE